MSAGRPGGAAPHLMFFARTSDWLPVVVAFGAAGSSRLEHPPIGKATATAMQTAMETGTAMATISMAA